MNQNEYNSIPFLKRKFNIKKVYEDGWRFTMITREPIDRFLSGYVDKCIRCFFSSVSKERFVTSE